MTRRYLAEFLGTFSIVFFGCGSVATTPQAVSAAAVPLVFGLVIAAMVYAFGHISAAHFNPAVTLAFASVRRFPWKYVPSYIIAQALGASTAAGCLLLLLGSEPGATVPVVGSGRGFLIEAILSFFLMLVIASVATDKRVDGATPGMAIGATVAACAAFAGPLTGASMNPARSLGPALFFGLEAMRSLWVYMLAPPLGAIAAALLYEFVRGDSKHATDAPNDLAVALRDIECESEQPALA